MRISPQPKSITVNTLSAPSLPIDPDYVASQWMLRPDIAFLNHGSFGAVPRKVFDAQTEWRRWIEAEPVELLARRGLELLDAAKQPVGQFLHMAASDFGFVTNATEGVNAVLRSLARQDERDRRDELLTTNHVYNAVRKAMQFVAERDGFSYREIDVPLPVASSDEIADRVIRGLSNRTRLLVIDHVTSPTALIFPVGKITAECNRRGIDVLIDGAHAPGMLDLEVPATGAAYYAGNLHKWCCCPKGSGFLWAREDRRRSVHPLIISHNLNTDFAQEFGWQGTRDVSAWLTIPAALEFMSGLGWEKVRANNHALATWAHRFLATKLNQKLLSPLDGALLGSMATVQLPPPLNGLTETEIKPLQRRLHDQFKIEMPLMFWGGKHYLRVACQMYNRSQDIERAADAVEKLCTL